MRVTKGLIHDTSARPMASSSATSTIQTPCNWMAASFEPSSGSSSVNQGSAASTLSAVDFRVPCGSSRMSMWSALTPGAKDPGHGRDQPECADRVVQGCGLGAEMGAGPGLEPGCPVPAQVVEPVPHRMDAPLAGDRTDGASDHDGGDVDAAQLQPFGGRDLVVVAPGTGKDCGGVVPVQRPAGDDLPGERVEGERTGKGFVGPACPLILASRAPRSHGSVISCRPAGRSGPRPAGPRDCPPGRRGGARSPSRP